MDSEKVSQIFEFKADEYDRKDKSLYWKLSDELLAWLLDEFVFAHLDRPFRILDAGGGRGRWIVGALEASPESTGTLFDISPEMIEQARERAQASGLDSRIEFVEGDLHDVTEIADREFDVVYSLHNVLGYVERPREVVSNLYDLLADGGRFVCDVPNLYHGVYFNTKVGDPENGGRVLAEEFGAFAEGMPEIHFFTPETIEETLTAAGFSRVETYGFPVTLYPGLDEAMLRGNTDSLEGLLGEETSYARILESEQELVSRPEAAARGNGLFAVAVK